MDKIISVYWFAILTIVAVAVVYMVSAFYSYPYDVREKEVNLLINKVADCLSKEGKMTSIVVDGQGNIKANLTDSFLEDCTITFKTEDTWEQTQYYILVEFFSVLNTNEPISSIEQGNLNLVSNCIVQKDEKYSNLAKCVERRFYSTSKDKQYLIKILGIVRKTEKNVK